MSFKLTFYVRIVLPKSKVRIESPLDDLDITIEEFLKDIFKEFAKSADQHAQDELKALIESSKIRCWNRPHDIHDKIIDLMSKVEKIDGIEADIFELKL